MHLSFQGSSIISWGRWTPVWWQATGMALCNTCSRCLCGCSVWRHRLLHGTQQEWRRAPSPADICKYNMTRVLSRYEENLLMSNALKRFSCLCSELVTNTTAAEMLPCACAHEWSQLVLQGTCNSGYKVLYSFQYCMGSKPAFQQVVRGLLKLVERDVVGCNWGNVRVRTSRRGLEGMKTMASMRYWKSVVEETDLK